MKAMKTSESAEVEISVSGVPPMKPSNGYRKMFQPTNVTIRYEEEVTARVRGPWIINGELSPSWTSRYFFSDLGIDAGPAWLRHFIEEFRPRNVNQAEIREMLPSGDDA